ncbi:MAG: DUF4113 domain-containing protein, partial [Candidatus Latescibacteria bacterium]|nr:DUF4113 domain-containing protein [Candidatus Latescibacterota bacterium]
FKDELQYNRSVLVALPVASDCTRELISYALRAIRSIFRTGCRFKKAGVILGGIRPANEIQADLFDTKDRDASKRVMAALDAVNGRMGAGTLRYAAEGIHQRWRTKFEKRSPRYTTRWEELPVVKA